MSFAPTQRVRDWWQTRAPRGQFWLYFLAAIFFNLGFSIFFFLFNLYLLSQRLNEGSLGLIGSLMAVGTLCGTLPAGLIAQRFGLRRTLTIGIGVAAVASILRVTINWHPAQLAFAVLSGCALCTWAVCLSPAVAGLTSEQQRPSAFSLMFASGISVAGLGAYAAGHLPALINVFATKPISVTQCDRAILILACGFASLALIPISRLTLTYVAPRTRMVFPSPPFLRKFLPAMAAWGLVTGAFPPFANVYFVHHLGVSPQTMGSVLSLSQFVQFVAILFAPVLFRLTGLASGVMLTQLVTAAMLISLAFAHGTPQAACLYWLYMSAQCMNEPGIYSLLMDRVSPGERNSASSYTFFISAGSQIIASTAVGFSILRFGYSSVLMGIAILAVIAALLFRRLPNPSALAIPAGAHQSATAG